MRKFGARRWHTDGTGIYKFGQLEVFWNDFEIIDLIVEWLQIFFSKEMGGFNFMNSLFSELTE